jgi:hypothetical protein
MLTAGCATTTRGRVYVRSGPPPVVVETRGQAGPGLVWVPGYQRWNGRGYVWVPGRYERAPRLHATWVPGRWVHDRRGWYYVDGRWR